MPEYRQDPLTGRIVIVAEERASRPHQFDIEHSGGNPEINQTNCPFCEGNESLTPDEITAFRSGESLPDTPGWLVRVIPNKFPAVVRGVADFPAWFDNYEPTFYHPENPLFRKPVSGFGHHEVIVDTPRHILSLSEMTNAEVFDLFRMYQERLRSLREENRWKSIQIFKNVGAAAGASLPHSHSQLIAMPFIPQSVLSVWRRAEAISRPGKTKRRVFSDCVWCRRLESELRERQRIVEETPHFVVLCPFVSRFSGEVEIYPKQHEPNFEE
ncbi:MAG: HIT domain-containing protein, partial [Planctomycetaceae bacterium]|nr:HIT domain-containing protein [Planctomycetaceae bacterium]